MNEHTQQHPPMKISLWSSKNFQKHNLLLPSLFFYVWKTHSSHPQKKYFSRFRKKNLKNLKFTMDYFSKNELFFKCRIYIFCGKWMACRGYIPWYWLSYLILYVNLCVTQVICYIPWYHMIWTSNHINHNPFTPLRSSLNLQFRYPWMILTKRLFNNCIEVCWWTICSKNGINVKATSRIDSPIRQNGSRIFS